MCNNMFVLELCWTCVNTLDTGPDITCIRNVDIITKAKDGEITIPRKVAKALWIVVGKKKEVFDNEIWPVIIE